MAITTLDGWIASVKQQITWAKTGTQTLVAATPFTTFSVAGTPGAGTLNVGNTANGVVPTDAVAGYPIINALGAIGYISKVIFGSTVACRLALYDRVFACGAYAYNANTTLATQPSYVGRMPNSNYNQTELWIEAVTGFTGNLSVQINYLDQGGGAGDTGVIGTGAALILGRMMRIPLAAGDTGVSQIVQVRGTVASAGTFNVMVLRPLWEGRVPVVGFSDIHDFLKTGLPQIYADSALYMVIYADSTAVGLPYVVIQIADG